MAELTYFGPQANAGEHFGKIPESGDSRTQSEQNAAPPPDDEQGSLFSHYSRLFSRRRQVTLYFALLG